MSITRAPRKRFFLFSLLALFIAAQVSWWIIYQIRYGERLTNSQQAIWAQQIQTVKNILDIHTGPDSLLTVWINENFEDLVFTPSDNSLDVKKLAKERLESETTRLIRMFIMEGTVFSLILAGAVFFVYLTLKREIDIERRQTVFLDAITHELKTPMTAARLFTETLLEREHSPELQEDLLTKIRINLDRLQHLIDRLLQVRFMLKATPSKDMAVLNLSTETEQILQQLSVSLEAIHSYTLETDFTEKIKARIDPVQFRLLVTNLVENAVKYSETGAVVKVSTRIVHGMAGLVVEDKGIGFDKKDRKRLFDRFFRAHPHYHEKIRGTGLGLYLVKEIVTRHKGKIFARSEGKGKGATFTVLFPLARGE